MKLSFRFGLLAALLAFTPLTHADNKISSLPAAGPIVGTEEIPLNQTASCAATGGTCKTTPAALDTYVESQLTSADVISKWSGTCSLTSFLRGDGACSLLSLTANVSGILPVANGGSGVGTLTGVLHGNGTGVFTAGNVALTTEVTGALPLANGGGLTTATDDNVSVGNGTILQSKAIPNCGSATQALAYDTSTNTFSCQTVTGTTGAPTTATYITQTPDAGLSAEQALSALSTGLVKNTTATGVLSIATLGTDYGDASTNTSSSVDSEIGLFSGTGGKTFKRSTGTGLSLLTSGVLSALAVTDDSLPLANGTTYQVKTVPDCTDITGNHLNYTASTNSFSCGTTAGAGTPAGSTTQIQFNLSSVFAGDAGLTYVGSTTQKLTVGTTANAGSIRAPDGGTTGGSLTIKAGNGGGTSNGGSLTLQGGDSANSGGATSGDLTLIAGQINGGSGGRLIINTGANTERFRILANGAWSVGSAGTDTGTSGQILTSAGAAAVPTWQTSPTALASSPTWTGTHTWSLAEPRWLMNETDQGSDLKLWDFDLQAGVLTGRTRTDTDGAGVNWLAVTRGATTAISNISLGDAVGNPTFNFLGSGTVAVGGALTANSSFALSGSNPIMRWIETDQGADLKRWQADPEAAIWKLRTVTDANGAGKDAIAVTRGTTTAISNVALGNGTDNNTFTFLGTGAFSSSGQFNLNNNNLVQTGTSVAFSTSESDQGTDLKRWAWLTNAGIEKWATLTDAGGAGKDIIAVTRGTTTSVAGIAYGNSTDRPTHTFNGNAVLANIGDELKIKEGTNAAMGVCTLVAGTCTVSNTLVTANSRVFLTAQSLGTVAVPSGYGISARVAGTSFTILASAPTDTSIVAWEIIEPAP